MQATVFEQKMDQKAQMQEQNLTEFKGSEFIQIIYLFMSLFVVILC